MTKPLTVLPNTLTFDDLIKEIGHQGNTTAAYKLALQQGAQHIAQHHNDYNSAWQAIAARTALIDALLIHCWKTTPALTPFSLVAVGGYGRGELHPYSDVDLMILVEEKIPKEAEATISAFVTRLWDFGLDIGHSVRTVKQCAEQSLHDVSVITNLMESRLLVGTQLLYQAMLACISADKIWRAHDFFRAKREEQQKRHLRFQGSGYRLESNVKEGPGVFAIFKPSAG